MGAYKFVDVAGRQWDNARYLNMLVRTTTARIARESFNQTLTDAGLDLIRFRNVGDSCPVCKAWDGVIISVSGADKRFPSYQEAINGGAWHPNCDCIQDYVDETLDSDAIAAQGETENVNWRDPKAVAKYSEAANKPVSAQPPPATPVYSSPRYKVPDELQKTLAAEGRTDVIAELERLPAGSFDGPPDLNVQFTTEAVYRPGQNIVCINYSKTSWHGHINTARHEIGHAFHVRKKIVTNEAVAPKFEKAIQRDLKALEKNGLFGMSLDELSLKSPSEQAMHLAQGLNLNPTPDSMDQHILTGIGDTLMGMTKGRVGFGHTPEYMRMGNNGAMEVFANGFASALSNRDAYARVFPSVSSYIKGVIK
jgi:hypothetical protein